MKENYKNLSVLYVDPGGMFCSAVELFAKVFGKVYYYCPNYSGRPSLNKSMIAERIENVKVIEQMFYKWNDYKGTGGDYDFNKIDVFIFSDIYMGDIQMHLVDIGKTVWGSRKAEELELLRFETKIKLANIGLAVTPTKKCENYEELFNFLNEKNTRKFLKLSWFRGIMESSEFKSMVESVGILGALKKSLECCYADKGKNAMELLAEDPIESDIEFGVDTFCIDGDIPNEIGMGFEIKNKAYLSTHVPFENLPKQLKDTIFGLQKLIREYGVNGCRSFIATEVRIDSKGQGHLCDITCRQGSPNSESQQEWIKNLPEIIVEGARGKVIEPKYKTKYSAQVAIYMPTTCDPFKLKVPSKIKEFVKLYNYCGTGEKDEYGIIPVDLDLSRPTTEIGYVIGYDNTIDGCFKKIREYAEQIEGENLMFMFDAEYDIMEELKKLKSMKIQF